MNEKENKMPGSGKYNDQVQKIWEQLVARYPMLYSNKKEIMAAYCEMRACFSRRGKLLICGNGGSGADAQHIVGELMKEFHGKRGIDPEFVKECRRLYPGEGLEEKIQAALPAIAIGVNQILSSAYANDASPEMVYAQEVFGYGNKGDILLGLSTSGSSENVINAVKIAKARGMTCIGMGGKRGGQLISLCDIYVALPEEETYLVQELTLPVYHAWCRMLECTFWNSGQQSPKDTVPAASRRSFSISGKEI